MALFLGTKRALLGGTGQGVRYYVDATLGNDANDGKTPDLAWQTIAKVNGETFRPMDHILFKRGEVFRETFTPPSSGIAGRPIAFDAYGSGDLPKITGSDLIVGWTQALSGASVWTAAAQTGAGKAHGTSSTLENFRNIIENAHISAGGTSVRVEYEASTGGMTITGSGIGERDGASDDYEAAPAPTRFQYGGSDISPGNSVVLGANASAWSDWLTFTIDETKDYLAHIFNGDGFAAHSKWDEGAGTNTYWNGTATDFSVTVAYAGTGDDFIAGISDIEIGTPIADVWQAIVTTEPLIVLFDGTVGNKQVALGNVNSEFDWFWESNVLYIYSSGGDPDTEYTSPGIEAGARDSAIDIAAKEYIKFENLNIYGCNAAVIGAIAANGGAGSLGNLEFASLTVEKNNATGIEVYYSDNNLVHNCTVQNNGRHGILFLVQLARSCDNNTIRDNACTGNLGWGIGLYGLDMTDGADNNTISGNTCNANGDGIYLTFAHSNTITGNTCNLNDDSLHAVAEGSGIASADGKSALIESNECANNTAMGIQLGGTGGNGADDCIVRYNDIHDNSTIGIDLSLADISGVQIYYNLIYGHTGLGEWGIYNIGPSQIIYNNVIYGNYNGLGLDNVAADNCIVKNNIISGSTFRHVKVLAGVTGSDIDYNLYHTDAATRFDWQGAVSNFANWKINSAQDGNSPATADPVYVNPGADDFHLQAGSPARNIGTDVSLTRDYDEVAVPQETNPAIGAFEYVA